MIIDKIKNAIRKRNTAKIVERIKYYDPSEEEFKEFLMKHKYANFGEILNRFSGNFMVTKVLVENGFCTRKKIESSFRLFETLKTKTEIDVSSMKKHIEACADVSRTFDGVCALELAMNGKNWEEATKLLLDAGAIINEKVLRSITEKKSLEEAKEKLFFLMEKGVEIKPESARLVNMSSIQKAVEVYNDPSECLKFFESESFNEDDETIELLKDAAKFGYIKSLENAKTNGTLSNELLSEVKNSISKIDAKALELYEENAEKRVVDAQNQAEANKCIKDWKEEMSKTNNL